MNPFPLFTSCLFLAAVVLSKAEEPMFAGIHWLTPAAEAKALMAAKGYSFLGNNKEIADEATKQDPFLKQRLSDLDLIYSGEMLGAKCQVELVFNHSARLVQVVLRFEDENHHILNPTSTLGVGNRLEDEILQLLRQKYGTQTRELDDRSSDSEIRKRIVWASWDSGHLVRLYSRTATKFIVDGKEIDWKKLTYLSVIYSHPAASEEFKRRGAEREKNSKKDDL